MRPMRGLSFLFGLSTWSGPGPASGLQMGQRPAASSAFRLMHDSASSPYGDYNRSACPSSCQRRCRRLCPPEPQDPMAPHVVLLDDSRPCTLPRPAPPPSCCPAVCFARRTRSAVAALRQRVGDHGGSGVLHVMILQPREPIQIFSVDVVVEE
jgi:hypothetical protein